MRHMKLTFGLLGCLLVMGGAGYVSAADIQMLPPEEPGVTPPATGTNCPNNVGSILSWDGVHTISCNNTLTTDGVGGLSASSANITGTTTTGALAATTATVTGGVTVSGGDLIVSTGNVTIGTTNSTNTNLTVAGRIKSGDQTNGGNGGVWVGPNQFVGSDGITTLGFFNKGSDGKGTGWGFTMDASGNTITTGSVSGANFTIPGSGTLDGPNMLTLNSLTSTTQSTTCPAGSYVITNGADALTCSTGPTIPNVPSCGANQMVVGTANGLTCATIPTPTIVTSFTDPCSAADQIIYSTATDSSVGCNTYLTTDVSGNLTAASLTTSGTINSTGAIQTASVLTAATGLIIGSGTSLPSKFSSNTQTIIDSYGNLILGSSSIIENAGSAYFGNGTLQIVSGTCNNATIGAPCNSLTSSPATNAPPPPTTPVRSSKGIVIGTTGQAYIDTNGNEVLGSGTLSAQVTINGANTLDSQGDTVSHYVTILNGQGVFTDGILTASCSGCNNAPSDFRLKKNIEPAKHGLAAIEKLQPVYFDYLPPSERTVGKTMTLPTDKHQLGFIAQDVAKVVPEAVSVNASTDTYSLDQTKLVPLLVKAVQELKADNDDLHKEIDRLKAQK